MTDGVLGAVIVTRHRSSHAFGALHGDTCSIDRVYASQVAWKSCVDHVSNVEEGSRQLIGRGEAVCRKAPDATVNACEDPIYIGCPFVGAASQNACCQDEGDQGGAFADDW